MRTQPQGSLCTAHVFHQIPGQNRIFMAWYSQGTQVVDFTENPDGTIDFKEAGYFIPANENTWSSAVFKAQRNPDGTFTLLGCDRRLQPRRGGPQRDRRLRGHAARPARPAGRHRHRRGARPRREQRPGGERCATVAGFRRAAPGAPSAAACGCSSYFETNTATVRAGTAKVPVRPS